MTRGLVVGFFCVLTLLVGCGVSPPVPEDRFYQLDAVMPAQMLSAPVLTGGLAVAPVTADPMRRGRAILFRDAAKPLEVKRYHYEFWVDEPPEMIRAALIRYLDRSGLADQVRDGDPRVRTAYNLQTRLRRFEQLVGEEVSGVEVEMEVVLHSRRSESILWSKVYRQRLDAPLGDMHQVAQAMQTALDSIFHAIAMDIQSLVASR